MLGNCLHWNFCLCKCAFLMYELLGGLGTVSGLKGEGRIKLQNSWGSSSRAPGQAAPFFLALGPAAIVHISLMEQMKGKPWSWASLKLSSDILDPLGLWSGSWKTKCTWVNLVVTHDLRKYHLPSATDKNPIWRPAHTNLLLGLRQRRKNIS